MDNFLSINDLQKQDIESILELANEFDTHDSRNITEAADQRVCLAFFEPSTRTKLSFEVAAQQLGMKIIGFSDASVTSSSKGESLEDTARVLGGYADLLVIRHPEKGAAVRAANASNVPVINAGDGNGEHPTQTIVDLYTIRKELGRLDVRVGIVGDLRNGRAVHSLVHGLQMFGADVVQIPAWGLEMDGVPQTGLAAAASDCDVLYVTRIQRERFEDETAYESAKGSLIVDRELLESNSSKAIILHPLPRVDELSPDVDELVTAKYFDQAANGVPVRMAILQTLLGGKK